MSSITCTHCNKKCRTCQKCHKVRASYGRDDQLLACSKCKDSDMTLYVAKSLLCESDGCLHQKSFGPPLGKKTRCAKHKIEGDILLSHPICDECQEEGVNTVATFGLVGEKAHCCAKHKTAGMVDLKNKMCISCKQRVASYRLQGKSATEYCKTCANKEELQVELTKVPLCETCCAVVASYGVAGTKKAQFCLAHKPADFVEVRSTKCFTCTKFQGHFISPSTKKRYCSRCAPSDCVYETKLCSVCRKYQRRYGLTTDNSPSRCTSCRLPDDVCFYGNVCTECKMTTALKPDSLCDYCDPNGKMRNRTIEKRVVSHVISTFEDHNYVNGFRSNLSIGKDCDGKRPDLVIDCGYYFIVLEIDEFQHKTYDKDCEFRRMNIIAYSLGLPVKFIRFNPHSFRDSSGLKVNLPLTDRLDTLVQTVHDILNTPHDLTDFTDITRLFFDMNQNQELNKVDKVSDPEASDDLESTIAKPTVPAEDSSSNKGSTLKRSAVKAFVTEPKPSAIARLKEDGTVDKIFASANIARQYLGKADSSNILYATRSANGRAYNMRWSLYNPSPDEEHLIIHKRKLAMIDDDGEIIATFTTSKEAAKELGLNSDRCLTDALKNPEMRTCGHRFRRLEGADMFIVCEGHVDAVKKAANMKRRRT